MLEKVVKPVMLKVGRARWYRDTITDLGFALASEEKGDKQTEDASKILEEDVTEDTVKSVDLTMLLTHFFPSYQPIFDREPNQPTT